MLVDRIHNGTHRAWFNPHYTYIPIKPYQDPILFTNQTCQSMTIMLFLYIFLFNWGSPTDSPESTRRRFPMAEPPFCPEPELPRSHGLAADPWACHCFEIPFTKSKNEKGSSHNKPTALPLCSKNIAKHFHPQFGRLLRSRTS